MSVSQRIRMLRKELKLSQEAFGERVGVSKGVIVNIELERAPVKELMLKMICRTFDVNPLWLEKGEGEMFLDVPDAIQCHRKTEEKYLTCYINYWENEKGRLLAAPQIHSTY